MGTIRSALIRAVLGTDMGKHAETLTKLDALIDNLEHDGEVTRLAWYWPATPPGMLKTDKQRAAWVHKLQEEFVMEIFLHACDIGTVAMPFDQFRKVGWKWDANRQPSTATVPQRHSATAR